MQMFLGENVSGENVSGENVSGENVSLYPQQCRGWLTSPSRDAGDQQRQHPH